MCSKGYPDKYQNNIEIGELEHLGLNENDFVFHAGTKMNNSKIISNGGRVLNIVITSDDLKKSRKHAIDLLNKLNWSNGFFRKDIGFRIID